MSFFAIIGYFGNLAMITLMTTPQTEMFQHFSNIKYDVLSILTYFIIIMIIYGHLLP